MATSNVNKIVRGNLNLKPWILNKTPTDIVNSYVQQLYKRVPDSYKNNLFKPRNNYPPQQPVKRPPPFTIKFPIVSQPKKTLRPNGYRSSQITVNNNFLPAPKRFLKSPNFKIYNSRKYSSASSSGASFIRSDHEERRKQLYKPAIGMQVRTYAGTSVVPNSSFYNSPAIAKYIGPTRIFNDVSQHVKCSEITNAICKDLMSVDKYLKEKIRLVRPKPMRMDPQLSQQEIIENSLKGWNHPTLANLNKIQLPITMKKLPPTGKSIPPEQSPSVFNMMHASKPKKSSSKLSKSSILPRMPRKENARYEPGPRPYFGVTATVPDRRNNENKSNQMNKKSKQPPAKNDSMDLVCRSRMDRYARSARPNQHICQHSPIAMECASIQIENQESSIKSNEDLSREEDSPKNPDRKGKNKSPKESLSPNQRRAKRRRRAISDADDFNVNFSKIKISESSRILRSNAKRCHQPSFENVCDTQSSSQSDAVSKDHSYSKASKRLTKPKDHPISTPTVHLKLFIGLTSNEDRHKESCNEVDPLPITQHFYRRSSKIEIIDFDDLELSNDCHGDKYDHNCNDPSMENKNLNSQTDQSCKDQNGSNEDRCIQATVENNNYRGSDVPNEKMVEKSNDQQGQCKPTDDPDQNFNPKTDYEKLLAKYGEADLCFSRGTSFLEHSHWMLESDIMADNVIDEPRVVNEDTLEPPVYLDLDQNRIAVSSPQKLPTITQSNGMTSVAVPTNFPSGGCFQKLGTVVTSTVTKPEFQYCNDTAPCCLSNGLCFTPTDIQDGRCHQEPIAASAIAFPNFQTVFTHKIDSLIRSKPQGYHPNGKTILTNPMIANSFSTSGGSIERIVSPVIPKQPSTLKKYPGISVPFQEVDISPQALAPESTSFEGQNGQQPDCRIHLVETPPSFTRTSQPEVSPIIARPQTILDQTSIKSQHPRMEASCLNDSEFKTSNKPKRTRRTRAQMEIYRQELARNCRHRSKRNQRFTSRTSRHIVGRNFSMEYRRVHSHPQEFLYTGPPTRFPHYMRPQAVHQHRYSETYSVNETNLFGVSGNSNEWPQLVEHFPSFSHGLTEFRTFEPIWPLNAGIKNLNSYGSPEAGLRMNAGGSYQKYPEPLVDNLQNPSSVMWNQQVRSIQLQSAYGNVQQVPVATPRLVSDGRRTFTPWPLATSLEQLSTNLADLSTSEPISQMEYY